MALRKIYLLSPPTGNLITLTSSFILLSLNFDVMNPFDLSGKETVISVSIFLYQAGSIFPSLGEYIKKRFFSGVLDPLRNGCLF